MILDVNCLIGRRAQRARWEPWSRDDLLKSMRTCGIESALVRHAVAVEYDPVVGNKLLHEELESSSGLAEIWVVAPHETSDVEAPGALIRSMAAHGVRAVAVYPATHGSPWTHRRAGRCSKPFVATRFPFS